MKRVWEREGAVTVGCSNEKTDMWFINVFSANKMGNIILRVLLLEELPKWQRVVKNVDEEESSPETFDFFVRETKIGGY